MTTRRAVRDVKNERRTMSSSYRANLLRHQQSLVVLELLVFTCSIIFLQRRSWYCITALSTALEVGVKSIKKD